jgi:hypothetical protein
MSNCIRCGLCCIEFPECGYSKVENGKCIYHIIDKGITTCQLMVEGKIPINDECIIHGLPWSEEKRKKLEQIRKKHMEKLNGR